MRILHTKRLVPLLLAATAVLSVFSGCTAAEDSDETLFVIGDHKVSYSEFTVYTQIVKSNIASMYGDVDIDYSTVDDDGNVLGDLVKEEAYKTLLFNTAYIDLAKQYGFEIDSDARKYLKEVKDSFIEQCGGRRGFVAKLLETGMSEKRYDMVNELYYSVNTAREILFGEGGPFAMTNEEKKAVREKFYNEYVNCSHILISTVDLTSLKKLDAGTLEEKRIKADKALAEVQKGEKEFDRLIEEYSDDIDDSVEPPYSMYFTHGDMEQAFEDAAYALKIGETSGLVQSSYGYHIIKRLELDDSYLTTLLSEALEEKINETVYEHQKTMTVVTTNKYDTLQVR